jgi:hypothetical protein
LCEHVGWCRDGGRHEVDVDREAAELTPASRGATAHRLDQAADDGEADPSA